MGTWGAFSSISSPAYKTQVDHLLGVLLKARPFLTGTDDDDTSTTSDDEEDPEEYREALGTRPPLPEEDLDMTTFRPLIELFCCCTSEDPTERPSAEQVVDALRPHVLAAKIEM